MTSNTGEHKQKRAKVLVVMSEDTRMPAGILSEDPSIRVEVIWNYTEWKDIPRGYKSLARIWGFAPEDTDEALDECVPEMKEVNQ
jgi:hypothetical protein